MSRRRALFHLPGVPWLPGLSPFFVPPFFFPAPPGGSPKNRSYLKNFCAPEPADLRIPSGSTYGPPGRAGGGRRAGRRRRRSDLPGLVWCWLAVACAGAGCGAVVWAVCWCWWFCAVWLCPLRWWCWWPVLAGAGCLPAVLVVLAADFAGMAGGSCMGLGGTIGGA